MHICICLVKIIAGNLHCQLQLYCGWLGNSVTSLMGRLGSKHQTRAKMSTVQAPRRMQITSKISSSGQRKTRHVSTREIYIMTRGISDQEQIAFTHLALSELLIIYVSQQLLLLHQSLVQSLQQREKETSQFQHYKHMPRGAVVANCLMCK